MSKMMKIIGAVAVINIVARLFGFLREMAIGNQYGTSSICRCNCNSIYDSEFHLPCCWRGIDDGIYICLSFDKSDKALYVRKSFTTVLVAAVAITVVLMIFTDPLLHLFFKDLTPDEFAIDA